MGELIAVLSGKGGTGKTSVCAGIATALASSGKQILCIDCDVGLRNLDISLGMSENFALSFLDICEGDSPLNHAATHPIYPSLHFLTAPLNRSPESIDPELFGQMLTKARAEYDYIFLDAPAGIDAGFRLATTYADRCILVTGPSPAAIRDASRTGEMLELMGKENIRLVVNRISKRLFTGMSLTVDDVMDNTGFPLLGIIPEDPNVTLAAAFSQPLLQYRPRSGAAQACHRIAHRIQGLPVPIKTR